MRAANVLQKALRKSLGSVHLRRWNALWGAVRGLIVGGVLTQAGIAKAAGGSKKTKHRIKWLYRLTSNTKLHADSIDVYRAVAAHVLGHVERPIILVDWTPITAGLEYHGITATTPCNGRAIQIYAEVHPEKKLQNPRVEKKFLAKLKAILPEGCRPIIVTDGGFRTPWCDEVKRLGWDYLGRLRHKNLFQCQKTGAWRPAKDVWELASTTAQDLGFQLLTRSSPRKVRMVLIKEKRTPRRPARAKPPRNRPTNRRGPSKKSKTRRSISQAKAGAKEPWLLVTSLEHLSAAGVVSLYKTRMQIEETYRDIKNVRFGWSLDQSKIMRPERIAVLMLLATLAGLVVLTVGIAAEEAGLAWQHQANTTKDRRVRSLFSLGCLLLIIGHRSQLTSIRLKAGIARIRWLADDYACTA